VEPSTTKFDTPDNLISNGAPANSLSVASTPVGLKCTNRGRSSRTGYFAQSSCSLGTGKLSNLSWRGSAANNCKD
jgi:hypothetical protein